MKDQYAELRGEFYASLEDRKCVHTLPCHSLATAIITGLRGHLLCHWPLSFKLHWLTWALPLRHLFGSRIRSFAAARLPH